MNIIEIKNLRKRFDGVHAVDDLSLNLEKGIITGIIGPNGSGKTTLINLLSGMLKIDSGKVAIDKSCNDSSRRQTARHRKKEQRKEWLCKIIPYKIASYGICRTFQNPRLFEQMTVMDNILVVLTERSPIKSLFKKHSGQYFETAKKILEKMNLWEKKDDLAINLSYGQRKLLEIGRALAMNSEIYFFDEPFAGLFTEMVKIVSMIIKELKENGKTIILIEHDMNLIRTLSDFVYVMDEGKVLAKGTPRKVLADKKVIDAYLG